MKPFQYQPYLDSSFTPTWRKILNSTKSSGRRAASMTGSRKGVMPIHNITYRDIMAQYEKQQGLCYWSGVPLRLENQEIFYHPLALSVDRILNDKGYIANNIVITARLINLGKNQYPSEGFPAVMREFKEGFTGYIESRKWWQFWK
tara:strand:+ start:117 stop:554 length:438 start_codon:yes stop_codon:yes gene_type:complete